MATEYLISKTPETWYLKGLEGMDLEDFDKVIDAVFSDPACPHTIVIEGEEVSWTELRDSNVRTLLWQRLIRKEKLNE